MKDFDKLRAGAFDRLADVARLLKKGVENADKSSQKVDNVSMSVLRQQQRFIDAVVSEPKTYAVVLAVEQLANDDLSPMRKVLVSHQGIELETHVSRDMQVVPGDEVSLLNATLQPVEVVKDRKLIGDVATVSRVVNGGAVEIFFRGSARIVLSGAFLGKLEAGDRVVTDPDAMIVIACLGKSVSTFQFLGDAGVTWDRIVGCKIAIEKLRDAIEIPYLRSDVYVHYHDEPPRGIALIGDPGCGKTLLLRASAKSHRDIHKENAYVIWVNATEILEGIVGDTEKLIKGFFDGTRAHFRKTGVRALLIIDEAEALLPKRGSGRSSDVEKSNVATFLAEMGGLGSGENPILLIATNRPDLLDEAITRDERIDEVIVVPSPIREDALAFFKLYLGGVPIGDNDNIDDLAHFATEEFFSSKYALAQVERRSGAKEPFTLGHIVNGAMLRGVVRRAIRIARTRDLTKTKAGESLGVVTREDLVGGIEDAFEKNRVLDYRPKFLQFLRGFKGDIAEEEKVLRTVFN